VFFALSAARSNELPIYCWPRLTANLMRIQGLGRIRALDPCEDVNFATLCLGSACVCAAARLSVTNAKAAPEAF
jgi:hypothetical protein